MNTITSPLLTDLVTIYHEANRNNDNDCCMVAPSPELNEQIKQELSRLKKRVPGVLSSMVWVKDGKHPV